MSKVVIAQYCVQDAFIIPDHIDLENKAQVKFWGVKWNQLFISFVDGTELTIDSQGWTQDIDLKHPEKTTIENAEDYGIEPEDEEEELCSTYECGHTDCMRKKPCECGCGLLGGSCEVAHKNNL
jgi:hypothetical protein